MDSLAFGGDAVGRVDGKVAFIALAAPGDQLRVRVVQQHASFLRAEILEIVCAGPARRDPICPLFGRCGGCQWQHVRYPQQALAKRQIVADALRLASGNAWRFCQAPSESRYRRRARLRWQVDGAGVRLGFFQVASKEIVDVDSCPMLVDELDRAVAAVRVWLGSAAKGASGTAALLCGWRGQVHASVRVDRGNVADPLDLRNGSIVGGTLSRLGGPWQDFGAGSLELDERGLAATAAGFSQVNASQDVQLRAEVLRHAQPIEGMRVLELFAGAGNLTLELMRGARSVTAVESEAASASLLQRNVGLAAGVVQVVGRQADRALTEMLAGYAEFDLVVLDPPRQGARQVVEQIGQLRPGRVVYVSCDPMTLARDLASLAAHGYELVDGSIVDMMPQTYHVEIVAQLRRVGAGGRST